VSLTITAAPPSADGIPEAPTATAPVSGAGFAAALRDFSELDEQLVKRFARINAMLRVGPPAYPDLVGCRSWLVW